MSAAVWHDLECGRYRQDLSLWHQLTREHGAPVLDIGAGTGRVSLDLARAGVPVVALDSDPELVAELSARATGLPVTTVIADARDFDLGQQFPLIIVPMQTIQLLGGASGRRRFLGCAREHLLRDGVLAVSLTDSEEFEEFRWQPGDPLPLPDVTELDGIVYSSQPTAVRRDGSTFVLERARSVVDERGGLETVEDQIALDLISVGELDGEVAACGLQLYERRLIAPTLEHVGSQVVIASG